METNYLELSCFMFTGVAWEHQIYQLLWWNRYFAKCIKLYSFVLNGLECPIIHAVFRYVKYIYTHIQDIYAWVWLKQTWSFDFRNLLYLHAELQTKASTWNAVLTISPSNSTHIGLNIWSRAKKKYMIKPLSVLVMVYCLFGAKPFSTLIIANC